VLRGEVIDERLNRLYVNRPRLPDHRMPFPSPLPLIPFKLTPGDSAPPSNQPPAWTGLIEKLVPEGGGADTGTNDTGSTPP
jgi:hypothetical protein